MLTISPSKLRKCTACMYQYKLYYIDGWRPRHNKAIFAFGNVCHEVVTDSILGRFKNDPAMVFTSKWRKNLNSRLSYNNGDSFEKLMEMGTELCRQIPDKLKGITAIQDIEKQFTVKLGHIQLNGYIDFICQYKRKPTLFEIKTVRSFADHEVEMSDQLTLYSMARNIPRVGIIALLKRKTNPQIEIHTATRTAENYRDLKYKIKKAVDDITHRHYHKVNDKMTCQMCDFLPICYGTKSEVRAKLKQIDIQHHTKNIQRKRKLSFW